jgi:hypothetical protein
VAIQSSRHASSGTTEAEYILARIRFSHKCVRKCHNPTTMEREGILALIQNIEAAALANSAAWVIYQRGVWHAADNPLGTAWEIMVLTSAMSYCAQSLETQLPMIIKIMPIALWTAAASYVGRTVEAGGCRSMNISAT